MRRARKHRLQRSRSRQTEHLNLHCSMEPLSQGLIVLRIDSQVACTVGHKYCVRPDPGSCAFGGCAQSRMVCDIEEVRRRHTCIVLVLWWMKRQIVKFVRMGGGGGGIGDLRPTIGSSSQPSQVMSMCSMLHKSASLPPVSANARRTTANSSDSWPDATSIMKTRVAQLI